jgi:DEAD/DEAH box helicase domain-containing protein
MHAELRERLAAEGMERLYVHQAEAYEHAVAGDDVVVVTGTNSGKTLCYNLPVVQMCITEPVAEGFGPEARGYRGVRRGHAAE